MVRGLETLAERDPDFGWPFGFVEAMEFVALCLLSRLTNSGSQRAKEPSIEIPQSNPVQRMFGGLLEAHSDHGIISPKEIVGLII